MKSQFNWIHVLVVGFVCVVVYGLLFQPAPEIVTEIEYLPGDTVTVFRTDTLSFSDTVFVYNSDTVWVDAEGKHHATASFNLGTDSAGVAGRVNYDEPAFSFEDIKIRHPTITITVVDTLKETTTITKHPPFFEDTWFWTTIGGAILIFLLAQGGG